MHTQTPMLACMKDAPQMHTVGSMRTHTREHTFVHRTSARYAEADSFYCFVELLGEFRWAAGRARNPALRQGPRACAALQQALRLFCCSLRTSRRARLPVVLSASLAGCGAAAPRTLKLL